MDKLSTYLLRKIDCNCNDCALMQRSMERYKESTTTHEKWQRDYFIMMKERRTTQAYDYVKKYEYDKAESLFREVDKMVWQFDKSTAMLQFGQCVKYDKLVVFQPNVCQPDTQHCFVHRLDLLTEDERNKKLQ